MPRAKRKKPLVLQLRRVVTSPLTTSTVRKLQIKQSDEVQEIKNKKWDLEQELKAKQKELEQEFKLKQTEMEQEFKVKQTEMEQELAALKTTHAQQLVLATETAKNKTTDLKCGVCDEAVSKIGACYIVPSEDPSPEESTNGDGSGFFCKMCVQPFHSSHRYDVWEHKEGFDLFKQCKDCKAMYCDWCLRWGVNQVRSCTDCEMDCSFKFSCCNLKHKSEHCNGWICEECDETHAQRCSPRSSCCKRCPKSKT